MLPQIRRLQTSVLFSLARGKAKLGKIAKNTVIDDMKPQFIALIAALAAGPAFAQSTITLDSFPAVEPQADTATAQTEAPSALASCLTDPTVCASSEHQAGWTPTMGDVQNIRLVDHEAEPLRVSTSGGTSAEMAQSLPSVDMEILFDYNSDAVRSDQISQLSELATLLKTEQFNDYRFLFLGHTDAKGSAEYNQDLSARRAESVARLVRGLANLEDGRAVAAGQGFTHLKTPHDPLNAQNRRVQLVLVPR